MMGKSKKSPKGGDGAPQKHLHSRISYLHQAAAYLATTRSPVSSRQREIGSGLLSGAVSKHGSNRSRTPQIQYLLTQLKGVSRKSQIRLGRDVKHSICRRCDTLMVLGMTSSQTVKNDSKYRRKPWADIFEVQCNVCSAVKRFPVGSQAGSSDRKQQPPLPSEPETSKTEIDEPPVSPGNA